MESAEIEALIDEFEQRVERLRALYDQYFMGLEKIEPAVLRKDVDRRLWVLRREQIRNTGLRFKLNTIVQRYNTYQQYWMRICREIENGTYKRDLRRAAKRFGTDALTIQARKRLGKQLQRELEAEQAEAASREDSESMDIDVDVELEDEPAAPPAPLPRKRAPAHVLSLDALDDLEDILGLGAAPKAPPPPREPSPSFGRLDNLFGEDDPDQTRPHPRLPGTSPAGDRPLPPAPPARSPNMSGTGLPPRTDPSPQALPARRPPPPPPSTPAIASPPRSAPTSTSAGGLQRKAPALPPAPSPVARAAPGLPSSALAPSPPPQAIPSRAPSPPQPKAGANGDSALSETRVREIYAKYVQAKRECRESTSGITEDALTRSLRATAEKLKTQHKGRQIDFDVVIKDGKAVLKPVVKA